MADLTLADVERTEGSLKRYQAAQSAWNAEHPNHTVKAQDELRDAYSELAAGAVFWSPALLALAREALERRRDG